MDLVLDLLATVSRWSRSHLSEIALANSRLTIV